MRHAQRRDHSTAGVVMVAAIAAAFMIAQQIAAKAVRDAFFLTEFDVAMLPVAMLAAALVSLCAALALGKFIATFTPARAVPVLFGANGVLFALEATLVADAPRLAAAALYLHTAAFGGAVISGFWSVLNERFDPYTARKVMSKVAGGATMGGVLGGVITWGLAGFGTAALLLCFAGTSAAVAFAIALIARERHGASEDGKAAAGLFDGVKTLGESSYLRRVALIVTLGALTTGLVDYVFKAGVVDGRSGESLTAFFAVFYTATGVATFLLQAGVAGRILKALGVVRTAGLFPITTLTLSVIALGLPGLLSLVLLRGGGMVAENSLYRAGYELLYTPVPKAHKRSAKMLIDLGFDRLGTAAASGVTLLVIASGVATDAMLLVLAIVSAVASVLVLRGIRREYVDSLADRLRASMSDDGPQVDPSRVLASTFVDDVGLLGVSDDARSSTSTPTGIGALDHEALMAEVRRRAEEKRAAAPEASAPRLIAGRREVDDATDLLDTPIRARLREAASSPSAWAELCNCAPRAIGQIGDILLSRREALDVRVRAAELLATVPSKRASEALVAALDHPEARLRRACALALLTICRASPLLRPPRATLIELAARELRRPSLPVEMESDFERDSPFLTDARGNELASSVELVFLLLAIDGRTEELHLALTAITSQDAAQRGTGLEYLDNLLPSNLRRKLVGLAEHPELAQKQRRVDAGAITELAAQMRSGAIGVTELRRRYRKALKTEYDGQTTSGSAPAS